MEQFLCAKGYSDKIAGIIACSFIISGILGAFPMGMIANRIRRKIQATKLCVVIVIVIAGASSYVVTLPGQTALLITIMSTFRFLAIG